MKGLINFINELNSMMNENDEFTGVRENNLSFSEE